MRKLFIWLAAIAFALNAGAQSKEKNAMTLRLVDIKVTDGTLVNIAKEQSAKGNNKPAQLIEVYEANVRAKLDEVAKASGRFEISDAATLETLTRDAEAELFLKMSKAERVEYVTAKQNDYALSCDINSCQFTRKAGGAGYSCIVRLKVSINNARSQSGAALISREFISDIKKTAIRPNRDAACQEALATLTEPLTDFFLNNIPVYGLLGFENDEYIITCGSNLRIREGDKFQVSLVKYNGSERESEAVGVVKVKDLRTTTASVSFVEGKDRIEELIPTLNAETFLQCRLLLLKSY